MRACSLPIFPFKRPIYYYTYQVRPSQIQWEKFKTTMLQVLLCFVLFAWDRTTTAVIKEKCIPKLERFSFDLTKGNHSTITCMKWICFLCFLILNAAKFIRIVYVRCDFKASIQHTAVRTELLARFWLYEFQFWRFIRRRFWNNNELFGHQIFTYFCFCFCQNQTKSLKIRIV